MSYTCALCNFSTHSQVCLERHHNTKKHKTAMEKSTSKTGISDYMNDELKDMIQSMNDKITFLVESNLVLQEENEKQNRRISELENQVSKVKSNNVQSNDDCGDIVFNDKVSGGVSIDKSKTTINIQLNAFGEGKEWRSLTDEEVYRIMSGVNRCIPEMVKKLHFNDKYPENANIKIPNKKDSALKIYNGSVWETQGQKSVIDNMIKDITTKLTDEYEVEFTKRNSKMINELWKNKMERLTNEGHRKHKTAMREERNNVKYTILDNQS